LNAIAGPEDDDGKVGHWTNGTLRESDPWICCYCGTEFQTHEALKEHAPSHPEYVPNKCYVCGKDFSGDTMTITQTYHLANTK
jgi:hypothetical protein